MGSWIYYVYAYAKVRFLRPCPYSRLFGPLLPENDTLARIGTSCFQQLLENNVSKLSVARWERVVTAFVRLFKTTTPHQLFDETLRIEQEGSTESSESTGKIRLTIIELNVNSLF